MLKYDREAKVNWTEIKRLTSIRINLSGLGDKNCDLMRVGEAMEVHYTTVYRWERDGFISTEPELDAYRNYIEKRFAVFMKKYGKFTTRKLVTRERTHNG